MTLISLCAYRKTGKIVPPVTLAYDDVRVAFAREVEKRFHEMDAAEQIKYVARIMRGDDATPSDSPMEVV